MRRRALLGTHLAEQHLHPALSQLPGRLGTGQPTADHHDFRFVRHHTRFFLKIDKN
jgi:hypothetical protein